MSFNEVSKFGKLQSNGDCIKLKRNCQFCSRFSCAENALKLTYKHMQSKNFSQGLYPAKKGKGGGGKGGDKERRGKEG